MLTGVSGSGKSTLLGLLAGLDLPTTGEVWLSGQRLSDLDGEVSRVNQLVAAQRESLVRQFTALETAISQMQSTSNFLSAQLASLTGLTSQTTG